MKAREASVDRQLMQGGSGPVAEPAVDAALASMQCRDRIAGIGYAAVQFGAHRAQQAAPAMRRRHRDETETGGREHHFTRHRQPQIHVQRHPDHLRTRAGTIADHHRSVGGHQGPPGGR
ncbi:Uncharacterised protein [Mycobacterium tuberculosis]|nr:Uncharacterised protein [Mycobacterium tuberculosis]